MKPYTLTDVTTPISDPIIKVVKIEKNILNPVIIYTGVK